MCRKRSILRLIVSCFILSCLFPVVSSGGSDLKTILYVNSYHPGYAWSDGILDGIRSVLKNKNEVELIVEYLYSKNHNSEDYFQKVQDVFREKYRGRNIHAVITSDDHALDFVLEIRTKLFPQSPLIFCGVDHVTPERIAGHDLIYEIKQGKSTKATIDMALTLQPAAKDVYFIGDTTKTGKTTIEGALRLEPDYRKRLAFHYLRNISTDELLDILQSISKNSIVIYFTFLKDKNGKTFTLPESMALVSQKCNAPVYCTWGFQPQLGIVGGAIMNGYKQGEFSVETALRIIHSGGSKSIPRSQTAPLAYMIDYSAFQSHGFEIKSLPESATLFNKPATIYNDYIKYRTQVWSAVAIITGLIVFVFMLRDRARKLSISNKNLSLEIDDRKRTAEALRESEERFRTFFMLGKVGMAITSPKKGWIRVNQQLCAMLGYSEEELKKLDWAALTHPDDLAFDNSQFNRVLKGEINGYSTDKRFIRKDGSSIHTTLWLACHRNPDGTVEYFIAHLSDNTKRKQTEEALQASREDLIESQRIAHVGSWRLDLSNNQVIWSEELYKMYGFDPALPPPPYTEHQKLFTPESWERLSASLSKTRDSGIPYELELETVREDGSLGWMWVRGETVLDENGVTVGLRGAAQDITERKRVEKDIARLNAELEQRVAERTAELSAKADELERVNKVFVERELRMRELKAQIAELERQRP